MSFAFGIFAPDRRRGFDAGKDRHAQIQQCHVWLMLAIQFDGLLAVRRFGDHDHVRLQIDDRADADARDQVILGDQNADWIRIFQDCSGKRRRYLDLRSAAGLRLQVQFAAQPLRALAHAHQAEMSAER